MLQVMLLGAGEVRRSPGGDVDLTPAATSLLAFLVLNGPRAHARDEIAETFWGELDADVARRRLNTAVWRLRRALEPAPVRRGTYLTVGSAGTIGLNADEVWADVTDFELRVTAPLARPLTTMADDDAKALADGVELYRGDLLTGTYDEWLVRERERLATLHLAAAARLAVWHQDRDAEASLRHARRVLDHDPLREDVHRTAMRAYADLGRRTEALRQYDTCRRLLADELRVDPLPETTALAGSIARGEPHAAPATPERRTNLVDRLRRLQRQAHELDQALQDAIDELER